MGAPHYSLRWNNHQTHILHAFDTLLQSEALVDVTLVCEETSFKAHKVVLSACSPYFQRIFCETPCKHPVIVLKDLKGWEVQAIVDFMYRGEISVGQEQLASLIRAAESLQVRGLAHTEPIPMDSKENSGRGSTPSYSPAPSVSMFPSQPHTPPHPHAHPQFDPRVPPHINFPDSIAAAAAAAAAADHHRQCSSPTPRRKQARPRRRSGESLGPQDLRKGSSPNKDSCDGAENLCIKKGSSVLGHNAAINMLPARPNSTPTPSQFMPLKMESEDCSEMSPQTQPVELTTTPSDHLKEREKERDRDTDRDRDRDRDRQREKEREKEISRHEYPHPPPNNIDSLSHLTHHDTSPLDNPSFPHLASISALSLTPPHMFSLDSHLGLFPGMESCRNALMNDISESRHENHHISSKKKMGRPKGQHSAPRGGPPRSWTNAELTEALSHVWNKKMTTSQASRIFGIPYNSLLMYVRGKYGKSLKLEQLKKECFGDIGGPLDLLGLGSLASNNNNQTVKGHKGPGGGGGPVGPGGPEPDLMLGPPGFNASSYPTANFYPDFSSSFPVPVGMVHLLPQSEKNRDSSPTRGPLAAIDYANAKEELNNQRLRSTPIDYTKEESVRNSPIKEDYHNSMDGEEEMEASPRSNHEMTPHRLIEQNGKD